MSAARERGKIHEAVSILGYEERTVRDMAARGELPGAAKIRGCWSFNLDKLRLYVAHKEKEAWDGARLQKVVSGATAPSMAAFKPRAVTSSGHFARTIQQLRAAAAKQNEIGR